MSSRYSSSSSGQSSSYYGHSSKDSLGLPGDEYRALQKRQNRHRLEAHFSHHGSSSYSRPRTSYQDVYLARNERLHISEVKNATRRALGSNFDFTDDGYNRSKCSAQEITLGNHQWVRGKYKEPIPQKYLDEYYTWSREDDEKYKADLYQANFTQGACCSTHGGLHIETAAIRPSTSYYKTPNNSSRRLERVDSVMQEKHEYARPQLVSKFSFDSDVPEKRSFFHRRR